MKMLFVKRGKRIDAEAEALEVGRHPGVVALVDVLDGALRTDLVKGARHVTEAGPLTPNEVAGVVASVAATLADLHDRGIVHGGLDASHVLLATDGRPILCSLGRGGEPADDVGALGELAGALLAAGRPEEEPPARRTRLGAGRRPARLGEMLAPSARPALAALIAEATAAEPDRRPTARALVAAVHERVPTARLPRAADRARLVLPPPQTRRAGRPARRHPLPPPARRAGGDASEVPADPVRPGARGPGRASERRRGASVAAALGGGLTLVAAVAGLRLLGGRAGGRPITLPAASAPAGRLHAEAQRDTGGPVGDGTDRGPAAVRVWPPEPPDFRDGVLTVAGARYALGRPGDLVVLGDWGCAGRRTPALLRPSTGQVFAFDTWPDEGRDAVARMVGTVPGGSGLRAMDADGDGCDDMEVTRPGAAPVRLEPAA
ncbi:MAG TPA: hypothetical protein VHM89_05090 [Acidimicrobiales bacterium]|nr:hypothetical protein [Acidimicrobiales bacterium]